MIDIDKLTEAELIDLNRRIIERLRMIQHLRAHANMLQFKVGEKVSFQDSNGMEVFGTLTKYNQKTVTVITEDGRHWRVSPGLLKKTVNEAIEVASSNIIELQLKKHRAG